MFLACYCSWYAGWCYRFHYSRLVEGDSPVLPFKVELIAGNTLQLEDGRRLYVYEKWDRRSLEEILKTGKGKIDIELRDGKTKEVRIWGHMKRRGYCGTPWAQLIVIPLIPDDIPINIKGPIGMAKIVE